MSALEHRELGGCILLQLDARSLRDQCEAAGVPFFLKQAVQDGDEREHAGDHWREPSLAISCGPGSKRKPGGVIELPYLDGVQHAASPEVTL